METVTCQKENKAMYGTYFYDKKTKQKTSQCRMKAIH